MTLSPELELELTELCAALREGLLDDNQLQRLDQLVTENQEARRFYLHYADLCASLYWARSEDVTVASERMNTMLAQPEPASISPVLGFLGGASDFIFRQGVIPLLLFCVCTLTGVLWWGNGRVRGPEAKDQNIADSHTVETEYVAELVGTSPDCSWDVSDGKVLIGAKLHAGQKLRPVAGVAEILFRDGARVILQGPADFSTLTASLGKLNYGQLTALVPKRAIGFTIHSPEASIVDLGTEFGLAVDQFGVSKVQVYEGEVIAEHRGSRPVEQSRLRIVKDEHARIDDNGVVLQEPDPADMQLARSLPRVVHVDSANRKQNAAKAESQLNVQISFMRTTAPLAASLQKNHSLLLGDIDGDGTDDIVHVRDENAVSLTWRAYPITGNDVKAAEQSAISFGSSSLGDIPLLGDFNGDGVSDLAVFRENTGDWYVQLSGNKGLGSSRDNLCVAGFGTTGDIPFTGDVNGDGRDDGIIVRVHDTQKQSYSWSIGFADRMGYIAGDGAANPIIFGTRSLGDIPVVADVNNDGRDDIGVYRAPEGRWFFALTDRSGQPTVDGEFMVFAPIVSDPTTIQGTQLVLGDMDGNGIANSDDIDQFVQAIFHRKQYASDHPSLDPDVVGDLDHNGRLDIADVDDFIGLLNGMPIGPEAIQLLRPPTTAIE